LIGILGGTFAPIHNGHLRLARAARRQLGLSHVLFVPAASPPLRAAPAAPAARRRRWVELAIAGERAFALDDRELSRPGPSWTVDTLMSLRREHPRAAICLLLGQDAAHRLPRWHRWRALPRLAHLVFFHRPGQRPQFTGALAALLRGRRARSAAQLRARPAGLWWRCAMPPVAISASEVRRRLREGQAVRGLVPDAVVDDFTRKDLEALARR
jgi:nicotinate-nucleotide adenylyltransferase